MSNRWFKMSCDPIDIASVRSSMGDEDCGAYVQFEGWIRNLNEGRGVKRLEYEAYEPLAVTEGQKIIEEAIEAFGLSQAVCIHRSGLLELGDCAVVAAVTSPHREGAFQGCRYIIDEVKTRLPIWKKEHYADGESGWVNCHNIGAESTSDDTDRP
jgi:molybdopterin synthase catalytic subunit